MTTRCLTDGPAENTSPQTAENTSPLAYNDCARERGIETMAEAIRNRLTIPQRIEHLLGALQRAGYPVPAAMAEITAMRHAGEIGAQADGRLLLRPVSTPQDDLVMTPPRLAPLSLDL